MQQKVHELRSLRVAAGVSLQKVASAAGIATQTCQRALSSGDVSDSTLAKVEAVLRKALAKKQAQIAKLTAVDSQAESTPAA
jgi:transcriptional regulator with XRE-family HTH domain